MGKSRNYQIDFLKLVFSIAVFFGHTAVFNEAKKVNIPRGATLGWIAVFFFFMVSGLLMINSYKKRSHENETEYGKLSMQFVINKFKAIAVEYWVSLAISLGVYIALTRKWSILYYRVPEVFAVTESGILTGNHNGPTWYISAMLMCMLLLYYLLQKDSDLFIYVLAPLGGLMIYGYLFSVDPMGGRNMEHGVIITTILKAMAGLLCGVISWLISDWAKRCVNTKTARIILTVAELFMYTVFFIVFIAKSEVNSIIYSITMLLIPALGITFSEKSYLCEIFRSKAFSICGPASLAIYFNHWTGRIFVQNAYEELDYWQSVGIMAIVTVVSIIVYAVLVRFVKFAWNKFKKDKLVSAK